MNRGWRWRSKKCNSDDPARRGAVSRWTLVKYGTVLVAVVAARIGLATIPRSATLPPRHYFVSLVSDRTSAALVFPGGEGNILDGKRVLGTLEIYEKTVPRAWPTWTGLPLGVVRAEERVVDASKWMWNHNAELFRDEHGVLALKLPDLEIKPVQFSGYDEYLFAYQRIGAQRPATLRVPLWAYSESLWWAAVFACAGLVASDSVRAWRRRRMATDARSGRCPQCRYQRGDARPCPECGHNG